MEAEESKRVSWKPHTVCVPYPTQGHITPMLDLAHLLHSHFHFHITFVNTHHNHRRLLRSCGSAALDSLPSFHFAAIPDGLPFDDDHPDATQDIPSLSVSAAGTACLGPFKELLEKLNGGDGVPPVKCIVADSSMGFCLDAAKEMGLPIALFWTASVGAFLGYSQYQRLIDEGIVPLKDPNDLTNGYMDQPIEGIPAMEGIRLKHLPSFIRTTDINDTMLNLLLRRIHRLRRSAAPIIFHTIPSLESAALHSISQSLSSPIFPIGPLHLHNSQPPECVQSNLWEEDPSCLQWLDSKKPRSVIYVNFGSIMKINQDVLMELAWGLARSGQNFLWVIRPDLVAGESGWKLSEEFKSEIRGRGKLVGWCNQRKVVAHPAIGGFLTHGGWNSVMESVSCGVPMIIWPFFADQMTNSWWCSEKWGVGVEIEGGKVKREVVEEVVKEVIEGEKGREMRKKAMEFKRLAHQGTLFPNGSSFLNFENLVHNVLLCPRES